MDMQRRTIIGVPIGDPNGIGCEVAVKAACGLNGRGFVTLLLGDAGLVERAAALSECGRRISVARVSDPENARGESGVVEVLDLPLRDTAGIGPGLVSAEAGGAAMGWLQEAVRLASAGRIDGIACAPANKEAMKLAGSPHSGQTALIGAMTGTARTGTVLVGGGFRVFQTTSHVSLRQACELITEERVLAQLRLARRVLTEDFGLSEPLIAVCGLNPHAGDGGLLGEEETESIIPAIERARAEGIRADGPLPGDTAFAKVKREGHDGIVAMYHDQANAVLKFVAAPVDVTLGLPIVRTTVGHGTAFDIAWRGVADAVCMTTAVEVAAQLAQAWSKKIKQDWRQEHDLR